MILVITDMLSLKNEEVFTDEDKKIMKTAIRLGEKARGNTSPNPMVGAVIVKNGRILSEGFHIRAGLPHAEVEAINKIKNKGDLNSSTMYVTLEPCPTYGKTPPCVDAIIKYKIKKVVIGCKDPNPKVNGSGIEKLKKAGIEVFTGLFEETIKKQNEIFFKYIKSGSPFISCKTASSIDGKIAAKSSDSKWITSMESRQYVQKIRREYDCIATGINTVVADDPLLFPRKNNKNNKIPILPDIPKNKNFIRVLFDSGLKISTDSNIVKTAKSVKTIIFKSETAGDNITKIKDKINYLTQNNIDVITIETENNKIQTIQKGNKKITKLNLNSAIKILYKKYGITSILIESGPTLTTSFLTNNLIDKFYFFIAPKVIGGDSRFDMFSQLNIYNLRDTRNLKFDDIKKIGEDLMIIAYPAAFQDLTDRNDL
ncbi:MAG: bifunctional diaminohydroxyphosphoribosylaminopyrimidine deaminase/5-amino-6-(5-phosphoribosylamino)uracil reductase RibD [Actinobacteria bacterium]|nr:bifunctional diaminohydroxyphosphoribosylaminopyrimidine deaminase/5-amino-6-(5-phosphoribosylamino)uracil reductase RibD [Actinomycetota bacterium]